MFYLCALKDIARAETLAGRARARATHILNERGLHTGAGEAFDAVAVQWVRFTAKLPSLKQRLITAGMLTTRQLGELLLNHGDLVNAVQARIE